MFQSIYFVCCWNKENKKKVALSLNKSCRWKKKSFFFFSLFYKFSFLLSLFMPFIKIQKEQVTEKSAKTGKWNWHRKWRFKNCTHFSFHFLSLFSIAFGKNNEKKEMSLLFPKEYTINVLENTSSIEHFFCFSSPLALLLLCRFSLGRF